MAADKPSIWSARHV